MNTDEQREREMDAWWDDEVAGRPHPSTPTALKFEIEAIRDLHANDAPAVPTPAFAASLREDIMNEAAKMKRAPVPAAPSYFQQNGVYGHSVAKPAPRRTTRRGVAFVELAAAALLIFALAGTAFGGGAFDRFSHQVSTPIPAAVTGANGMYRGDSGRTGSVPDSGPTGHPALAWRTAASAGLVNAPVVAGDRAFFIETDKTTTLGSVTCIDVKTGKKIWSWQLDANQFSSPAVAGGLVFALARQDLLALDVNSGAVKWRYPTDGKYSVLSPAVANGLVYIMTPDLSLRAIDALTGAEAWRMALPSKAVDAGIVSSSLAVADGVVVAADVNGFVLAADAKDGHELWRFQAKSSLVNTPVISNGMVYLTAPYGDGGAATHTQSWIQALDVKTGSIRWQRSDLGVHPSIATDGETVYVASGGGVQALRWSDGEPLWNDGIEGFASEPMLAGGVIYVESSSGSIYGIDKDTGSEIWQAYAGLTSSPAVAGGMVIVVSGSAVYAIGESADATPTSGATGVVDLSGLPPCNPLRTAPRGPIAGTPSASLPADVQLTGPDVPGNIAQILTTNIPNGPAADAATIAGIEQTLHELQACIDRPDAVPTSAAFFTDDFFRRSDARAGGFRDFPNWPSATGSASPLTIAKSIVLPDGRVAVELVYGSPTAKVMSGMLVIFAKQDGRWLIDERYAFVPEYSEGQG